VAYPFPTRRNHLVIVPHYLYPLAWIIDLKALPNEYHLELEMQSLTLISLSELMEML
jgi:hypothetical protein